MADATTTPPPVMTTLVPLLQAHRSAVGQSRVVVRLVVLTLGSVVALGRHTLTQLLVALGLGRTDWSAWSRLCNVPRLESAAVQRVLLAQLLTHVPATALVPVVLDATQLARSRARFPGSHWSRAPRTPAWRPGIHIAQRWEGLSAVLPCSQAGESRAVPLRFAPLRSPRRRPLGTVPIQAEGQVGLAFLAWLRHTLDALGRVGQRLLVVGDGTDSRAALWAQLPPQTTLLARCACNRARSALPTRRAHGRGRQPRDGERGPTPPAALHARAGWHRLTLCVRGQPRPRTVRVSGPWLVTGAPAQPLVLLVVRGIKRGIERGHRRREPQYWLVSATPTAAGAWVLPAPVETVLRWAWQRGEVEGMHRERKSSGGRGSPQAGSPIAAQPVIPWVVWTYAVLILTGYRVWGLARGPVPDLGRWWQARRWSLSRLWQGLRQELWQQTEFQPMWTRTPDTWAEITRWVDTQTNAALGVRRRCPRPTAPRPRFPCAPPSNPATTTGHRRHPMLVKVPKLRKRRLSRRFISSQFCGAVVVP
jgi:hypothetical protein